MLRISTLRLIVLGAVAAALLVTEALDLEIFSGSRETAVAPGGFTMCGKGNRQNCVIDGDTIRRDGVAIRIAGIDAPETHNSACESERLLGELAAARLLELVNAGPFEIVHEGGRDTDKYGRKLRVLERGGRSFGDILVAEGLVRKWGGRDRGWCH